VKVFYNPSHHLHGPEYELCSTGRTVHPDQPRRADALRRALTHCAWTEEAEAAPCPLGAILGVHDEGYIEYLSQAHRRWIAAGESAEGVVPEVFCPRSPGMRPSGCVGQAGYHCFDTGTPILERTYEAAVGSAGCALSAAEVVLGGERTAYALCRPPGHHAGSDFAGGFCYLNNAAVAAMRLARDGTVAILDIDYHHGNGTQEIFYQTDSVLFVSLHADPNVAYPYYSGYADERGAGAGEGCTRNFPLPPGTDAGAYLPALDKAVREIEQFDPTRLIVSLGVDTLREDPLGTFALGQEDIAEIARRLAALARPTVVVQEGGYAVEAVGPSVVGFLGALIGR